ncbi:hypothetical protein DB347_15885 [Opitutaceae bacterium EW11]|nr:hypothetical protein DB347_15885 [Opitutaceae bacterium EW11]
MSTDPLPAWKAELDAIVGSRHGGQIATLARRLVDLDHRFPNIAEIAYQLAWTLDNLGKPADAVPHYERAVALGLPPNELSGALIGLGNCLRLTGAAPRAVELLESGKRQFPDHREFDLFLSLALHDAGRSADAVRLLIETVLETTEDPGLAAYQRSLRFHAGKL